MITLLIFLLLAQGFSFLPYGEFWITHCQDNSQQDRGLAWKITFSTVNALKQSKNTPGSRWQFRVVSDDRTSPQKKNLNYNCSVPWKLLDVFASHQLVFIISFSLYWNNWCKFKVKIRATKREEHRRKHASVFWTDEGVWRSGVERKGAPCHKLCWSAIWNREHV